MTTRRTFLKTAAACAPAAIFATQPSFAQAGAPVPALLPNSIPVASLPQHYDVDPHIHNLENGYWGIMPRSVEKVYLEQTAFVNKNNSIWGRNVLPGGACLSAGGREAREAIARMVARSPKRSPSRAAALTRCSFLSPTISTSRRATR